MLQAAAGEVLWPLTPDISSAVLARIEAAPGRRRAPRLRLRRPLVIAIASLLVLSGGAAALPGFRGAGARLARPAERAHRARAAAAASGPRRGPRPGPS